MNDKVLLSSLATSIHARTVLSLRLLVFGTAVFSLADAGPDALGAPPSGRPPGVRQADSKPVQGGPPISRVRIDTPDGVFFVYDAATPPTADQPSRNGRRRAGFLAYWSDLDTRQLYVFDRVLYTRADVGHALENLELDLSIDGFAIATFDDELTQALELAIAEPEDSTNWIEATRGTIRRTMGSPERNSDPTSQVVVAAPCPCYKYDPCCLYKKTTPGATRTPAPPAHVELQDLIESSVAIPECCPDDPPNCAPCCNNPDPCCGSSNPCCGDPDPCCDSSDSCCGDPDRCCGVGNPCCVSPDPCCNVNDPCCDSSDRCCNDDNPCCGSSDPCCGTNDPCCDSSDRCCNDDNPCCGSSDPCCGTNDPCCDSSDRCCNDDNPCCGSSDPCCNLNDICCGNPDPCCNDDNPCCGITDPCDALCGDPCACLNNCDDSNPCTNDACVDGACTNVPKCSAGTCCANGDCGACCTSSADCPDDSDVCTIPTCSGGVCGFEPKCSGQNCCANGNCCSVTCDACVDSGALSGGIINVSSDPVCIGDTITFTASGVVDSGGTKRVNCVDVAISGVAPTYAWTLTIPAGYPSPLPALSGTGPVVSVQAKVPGTYSATFTAGVGRDCPPPDVNLGSKSAMAIEVEFVEDSTQAYGFDDYTNRNNSPVVPYKSVEVVGWDDVQLESSAPSGPGGIGLASSNTAIVTVEPLSVAVTPATVTVWGQSLGSAPVNATMNGAGCASMEVSVHNVATKTLAIVLVHEENDDTQVLAVGQGLPNQHAIVAGTDGTLETVPAGDDVMVVINSKPIIHTGGDGVCDTSAVASDVQVIPLRQGIPDQLCVGLGSNAFRDTALTRRTDLIASDGIRTGSDGICNTAANSTDLLSTDIGTAFAVQDYLSNTIYNQAVVVWTRVTKLPPQAINFDLNRDGKLDVTPCNTQESLAVISGITDPSGADYLLFLVDHPDDRSLGCMPFSQPYGFIHVDSHLRTTQTTDNTIAHELGHGTVGLVHPDQNGDPDPTNLMHSTNTNPTKLRRGQWDLLNRPVSP